MNLMPYEQEHLDMIRPHLAECTVLLKKDGTFPLSGPCRIAAYGSGVRHTVKGGTGSGEVNSRFFVTIEEGLKNAGFTLTTQSWLDSYDKIRKDANIAFRKDIKKRAKASGQSIFIFGMGKIMAEPEYDLPIATDADAAIYVVSRTSGEGDDRKVIKGDVLLTDSEVRDILALEAAYEKFMLVLNVGGPVDLTPVLSVRNILLLSALGVETGAVLADLLLGKANPSGKLTTTWSGANDYAPMEDMEDINETRYREGIYVGYRYFDATNKSATFPFGYGLSYTEFALGETTVSAAGEEVLVKTSVTNSGKLAGRETVQVYLSVPSGVLDHPKKELIAFAKSKELAPGETEELTIRFRMREAASYDEARAVYFLEKGEYGVLVGTTAPDFEVKAVLSLPEEIITCKAKNVLGTIDFTEFVPDSNLQYNLDSALPRVEILPEMIKTVEVVYGEDTPIDSEIEKLIDQLSVEDAALLNIGGFNPNSKGLASIVGEASSHCLGAAGETAGSIDKIPYLVMADGPAGLRLAQQYYRDEKGLHVVGASIVPDFLTSSLSGPTKLIVDLIARPAKPKKGAVVETQYCTAIPIGTAIAQSFSEEFATLCGDIVGNEMERFHVHLWLAPALNIHRSILCGRNFEYYSEDPMISGIMAACITNGVQAHPGRATTIKHFAANNKECNRTGNDSMVSERTMREIYLKGFAICINRSHPRTIMTSYNLLNGTHTSEHRGLTMDILRAEFGFDGVVMTDWVVAMSTNKNGKHRNALSPNVAAAGGDLFMPGGPGDYKRLLAGIEDGTVSEAQIRKNAARVATLARELRKA